VGKELCDERVKNIYEKLEESQTAIKSINTKITTTLVFVIMTLVAIIVSVTQGLL
jgi:hypothetical protein